MSNIYYVDDDFEGVRVDKYLGEILPDISRSYIQKLLKSQHILVNKCVCKANYKVKTDDIINVDIPEPLEANIVAEDIPLDIIYEDDDILIVNKPAGTDVHRGSQNNKETLIDIIKSYLYQKNEYNPDEENSFSPAICNRLDRNTTGLVIAAKNAQSLREINERIRSREIVKKYLCICCGIISKNEFIKTDYLKKCQHNRVEIISNPVQGYKKIITGCKVISRKNNFTLAEINLITGRTHQIRAHLAYLGYPILGDGKYGSVTVNKRMGIFHQQLCAYSLEFKLNSGGILDYLNGKIFKVPDTGFSLNIF